MCTGRKVIESGGGPVAPIYLMLAYVGSSAGATAPAAGTRPRDPRASAILGGVFAVEASVPAVRVLAPRRFYDALDDAHQAQLAHFMLWCEQHQCAHQIDLSPADEDTGEIQITGWYQRPGQSKVDEVNWSYDSTWRGRVDTKAVMDAAKVEAGVGQGHAQAPRRPQGERSDSGPLH